MTVKFKAVVIDNQNEKFTRDIKEIDTSHLLDGNVLIKIDYSSLNYKDAMILKDGALYDIKTCNDFKWQSLFGRYGSKEAPQNYAIQLGTYGLYYRENNIKINKMALLFYNKNNSRVKELKVPRKYIDIAERYWLKVEELFKDGLPPIQKGFSPVEDWECNPKYCSFYETCGGGIKGIQERENKWTKR